MEWLADLESTCSALGSWDEEERCYEPGAECVEATKDLIRLLRRDDASHTLRLHLLSTSLVASDLIPLLKLSLDEQKDRKKKSKVLRHSRDELFDLILRLMTNLTTPELLLFDEQIPEAASTRRIFMTLQRLRAKIKASFVQDEIWQLLCQRLTVLLGKPKLERLEEEQLVIERILILLRNALHSPSEEDSRPDDEASVHDQLLFSLNKSGFQELVLFLAASAKEEDLYCMHALEIVSLMLKEQQPELIAVANCSRSEEERLRDQRVLEEEKRRLEANRFKQRMKISSRHSRFGGTFVVNNMKALSDDNNLIYHRSLQSAMDGNKIDFDQGKRTLKVAKNKVRPEDNSKARRSTLNVRLFLKDFCVEFLNCAYNNLMKVVKAAMDRGRAQSHDESYYLWAMNFFMHFNRVYTSSTQGFKVEFVSETMERQSFHYVLQQLQNCVDNMEHEKRNRPQSLLWSKRLHLSINAYKELLLNLLTMSISKNEAIRKASEVLRASVFYEPEHREVAFDILNIYREDRMTLNLLRDLIETNHVVLKILDKMGNDKQKLFVGKRVRIRASKKPKKTQKAKNSSDEPKATVEMQRREDRDRLWDEIADEVSSVLQDDSNAKDDEESQLKKAVSKATPFDAASERSMEEQQLCSLYNIQEHLFKKESLKALALMKASREVWPENEVFGEADAEAEDDFMTLREILFANIERPAFLPEQKDEGEKNQDETEEEPEEFEEENEELQEVEEARDNTYITDEHFDLQNFLTRFSSQKVLSCYISLLKHFESNSKNINHAVIKFLHRLAFDCKLSAFVFNIQLFRIFQRINQEYLTIYHDENKRGKSMDSKGIGELRNFAKHVLKTFFATLAKEDTSKNTLMTEMLFCMSGREALDLMEGYSNYKSDSKTSKGKKSKAYWSEDQEEQLKTVFGQFKEINEKEANNERSENEPKDLVEQIESFLGYEKSRRQIIKKLKELGLVQSTKELKISRRRQRRKNTNTKRSKKSNDDEEETLEERERRGGFLSATFVESSSSSSDDDSDNDNANNETGDNNVNDKEKENTENTGENVREGSQGTNGEGATKNALNSLNGDENATSSFRRRNVLDSDSDNENTNNESGGNNVNENLKEINDVEKENHETKESANTKESRARENAPGSHKGDENAKRNVSVRKNNILNSDSESDSDIEDRDESKTTNKSNIRYSTVDDLDDTMSSLDESRKSSNRGNSNEGNKKNESVNDSILSATSSDSSDEEISDRVESKVSNEGNISVSNKGKKAINDSILSATSSDSSDEDTELSNRRESKVSNKGKTSVTNKENWRINDSRLYSSSSDSSEEDAEVSKRVENKVSDDESPNKSVKRKRATIESDDEEGKNEKGSQKGKSNKDGSSSESSEDELQIDTQKKRKKIRRISMDSSSDSSDDD